MPKRAPGTLFTAAAGTAALRPTRHAQQLMAKLFYDRGQHFIAAACLLRQKGGDEYVVLHLFCQGLEIILKALLLIRDWKKYYPLLQNRYRHNLRPVVSDALTEFCLKPLRPPISQELNELDKLYHTQALRYGFLNSVFTDPSTIPNKLVVRRIGAVIRLAKRELARAAAQRPSS
jgi:hypothetical protein